MSARIPKPFKRGGAQTFFLQVRGRDGKFVQLALGTRDEATARRMARMLDALGYRGRQDWPLIEAVTEKRLSVASLYEAYSADALPVLRENLTDEDLDPWVEQWLDAHTHVATDTLQHYEAHVRTLIPATERYPRSQLSPRRINQWLTSLPGAIATKRKYRAALLAFCKFLVAQDVLQSNPVRETKVEGTVLPRDRHIDLATTRRLLAALPEPVRTIAAIAHGSGADLSQILALRRCDVDFDTHRVMLSGGKTRYRNRSVEIELWAWPFLRRIASQIAGEGPLFPSISRFYVGDKFREACVRIKLADYSFRDSRHSYAVRQLRSGASLAAVARQLGHANTVMVSRVYGRYVPTDAEVSDAHRKTAQRERKVRKAQ